MDTLALAMAIVCQFSAIECRDAQTVSIRPADHAPAEHAPGRRVTSAYAWYDPAQRTVFYVPAALSAIKIAGEDNQLAIALGHELTHVRQFDDGLSYGPATCIQAEAAAFTQQNAMFRWRLAGGLSLLPVVPTSDPWADLSATLECRVQFG